MSDTAAGQQHDSGAEQGASWLGVSAGGTDYLLALTQSGEIHPWHSARRLPFTKPWFLGVVNLRGALCGVADLAGVVGAAPPADALEAPPDLQRWLVALNPALGLNCALRVDALAGLKSDAQFVRRESSGPQSLEFFGPILVADDDRRWQVIDLERLSALPGFLSIAAEQG